MSETDVVGLLHPQTTRVQDDSLVIVRTRGAPFKAQGKAVLSPYKEAAVQESVAPPF